MLLVMTISASVFALSTLALAWALHAQTKSYNDVRFHVQLAREREQHRTLAAMRPELRLVLGLDDALVESSCEIAELEEKLRQMGEVVD